jgi:hypothetical protein
MSAVGVSFGRSFCEAIATAEKKSNLGPSVVYFKRVAYHLLSFSFGKETIQDKI